MREIKNPYDKDSNRCFGCATGNPIGLKLKFAEEGEYLCATWVPGEHYQGYPNILHGGIISALLDELAAWCISVKAGTAGVTTSMNLRYLSPVYINKGPVTMKARITAQDERNASVSCQLFDVNGKTCTEAYADFFLYPEEVARRKFRYPGREAFYQDP